MTPLIISFASLLILIGVIYIFILWANPSLYEEINWKKSPFKISNFGILCVAITLIAIGILILLFGLNKLSSFFVTVFGITAFLSTGLMCVDAIIISFKK